MLIIFYLLGFLICFGYCNKVEFDCGSEFEPSPNEQIYRGTDLIEYEHPWFCHFDITYKGGSRHCSGVLISREDILTAASCFDDAKLQEKKFINLSCGISSAMIPMNATGVKKHATFGNHNLALIKLQPFGDFSTHIRPICLTNFEQILEGSPVTVVGSGLDHFKGGFFSSNGNEKPLKAEITVRNSSKCNFTDVNKTICAGENFVGLRDGDEGAPLLAFYQKRYYLIGIVTLEREELPYPFFQGSYPILFTRIAAYCKSFLRDHSNVECHNNKIPIESTNNKGYSCGAVSESRINRKRATGENLNLLQPWYCKIQNSNFEICGATLISFKYVLSAAHCFNIGGGTLKDYTIRCGIDLEATAKILKVTKNADFNGKILENDIAVIELENEIGFNGKVGAACLIEDDEITVGNGADYLIAVGSDGGDEKTVKSIRLHASNSMNCEAELNIPTNASTSLCLESESTTSTELGDSGGPLLKKFNGRWHIVGIVSGGRPVTDLPKSYLHFTRVSGFSNFITKSTNQGIFWSTSSSCASSLNLLLLSISTAFITFFLL